MSLSADSEIFLLTVNVIKARANKSKIPQSRLHCEFKAQQMNILSQYKQKTISCRRLEIKRRSVRNGDFDFRCKAQVRTKPYVNSQSKCNSSKEVAFKLKNSTI